MGDGEWVMVQKQKPNAEIATEHVSIKDPLHKDNVSRRSGDPTPASIGAGVAKFFETQEKRLQQEQIQRLQALEVVVADLS